MSFTTPFNAIEADPGGFFRPTVTSPAPSAMSTSTATPSALPRQRAHPLRPGSMKETALINYIDKQLLKVNRSHMKKFSKAIGQQEQAEDDRGYESFKEVVKDIEAIIDVVWVSGTPSLQIPYLTSLAGLVNSYLPDYPFSSRSTFRLLKKLDLIFASLLIGEDVETGAPISGFDSKRQVISMTEKVRIKSIAETCRVAVVEARDQDDSGSIEDSDDMDLDVSSADEDDLAEILAAEENSAVAGQWEMEVARIYAKTIQLLGDEFGKSELIS